MRVEINSRSCRARASPSRRPISSCQCASRSAVSVCADAASRSELVRAVHGSVLDGGGNLRLHDLRFEAGQRAIARLDDLELRNERRRVVEPPFGQRGLQSLVEDGADPLEPFAGFPVGWVLGQHRAIERQGVVAVRRGEAALAERGAGTFEKLLDRSLGAWLRFGCDRGRRSFDGRRDG